MLTNKKEEWNGPLSLGDDFAFLLVWVGTLLVVVVVLVVMVVSSK